LVIKAGGVVGEIDSPAGLSVLIAAGSSTSVDALADHSEMRSGHR